MQRLLTILFIQLLFKFGLGQEVPIQKCLQEFPKTEYYFVQVHPSSKILNCIVARSKTEFNEKCPDVGVVLTDNFKLKIENERNSADSTFIYRPYMYEEHPKRYSPINEINIAEQLVLDPQNTCTSSNKLQTIIMQVFRYGVFEIHYAFLFLVPKTPPGVVFGYFLVPFKEIDRSMSLGKNEYDKLLEEGVIYVKRNISDEFGCNINELWKKTCESGGSDVVITNMVLTIFLWSLMLITM